MFAIFRKPQRKEMSTLFVLITLSFLSVLAAPPGEQDRVIVDDEKLWADSDYSELSQDRSNADRQASSKLVQFGNLTSGDSQDQKYYDTNKDEENQNWYNATTALFQKWGYKDNEIPRPFGSGYPPNSFKPSPEFATILRGLVEKIPPELEHDILNIFKENDVQDFTIQHAQSTIRLTLAPLPVLEARGQGSSTESVPVSPTPEVTRYTTVCEDDTGLCSAAGAAAPNAQQFIESVQNETERVEEWIHNSAYLDPATLAASHASLTVETVMEEDVEVIDHLIKELELIFRNAKQKLLEPEELQEAKSHLVELANLIHEVETIANTLGDETQVENECCPCSKNHKNVRRKSTIASGIVSRNEDKIIRELQKKEPPVDETAPMDVGWSALHMPQKIPPVHEHSNVKNQNITVQSGGIHPEISHLAQAQHGRVSPKVEDIEIKDAKNVITGIDELAKLDRMRQSNIVEEKHGHKGGTVQHNRNRPTSKQLEALKMQTLKKVIQDLHQLAADEEENFDKIKNKVRLNQVLKEIQQGKSPEDRDELRLQTILSDLEKDSEIEYRLQKKLHEIDSGVKTKYPGELTSEFKKLVQEDIKPGDKKLSKVFEDEVGLLKPETHHKSPASTIHQQHPTPAPFNEELRQLKEKSSHYEKIEPKTNHNNLDREIHQLEQIRSRNRVLAKLNPMQIKAIDDEIQLLAGLNSFGTRLWSPKQKDDMELAIIKIQQLTEGREDARQFPLELQMQALAYEIDNLKHIIPPTGLYDLQLAQEIKELENLAKTHGEIFNKNQRAELSGEIRALKDFAKNQGNGEGISAETVQKVDDEVIEIEDLIESRLPSMQAHDAVDEVLSNLHEITHTEPEKVEKPKYNVKLAKRLEASHVRQA